jgi:hypothetical protein
LGTLLAFTREAKSLGWETLAPAKQKVFKMPAWSAANLIHLKFYPILPFSRRSVVLAPLHQVQIQISCQRK